LESTQMRTRLAFSVRNQWILWLGMLKCWASTHLVAFKWSWLDAVQIWIQALPRNLTLCQIRKNMISKLFYGIPYVSTFLFIILYLQSLDYREFASLVTSTTILECACSIFSRDMSNLVQQMSPSYLFLYW